jgi:hypothetical protein
MRFLLPIAIVCLVPVSTLADTVALLSVTYTDYKTDSSPKERTDKVKETVLEAIERADMVPLDRVYNDIYADCADTLCAREGAEQEDADIGIVVSVVDKDGQFDIAIHLSTHPRPVAAKPFCSFNSMLQRVSGFVESALLESRQKDEKEAHPEEEEEAEDESEVRDTASPEEKVPENPAEDEAPAERTKPLSPVPFYAMVGATVVFGGSYAAIESYAYTKSKNQEDNSDLRPFQIANYALLGCTVASGITAVVLVFFTDFKARKRESRDHAFASPDLSITPAASPGGFGLSLSGRF